jgi:hypothetical protein
MNSNDWILRIGALDYRAPDAATLRLWVSMGLVPQGAFIRDPATGAWSPIEESSEFHDLYCPPTAVNPSATTAGGSRVPASRTSHWIAALVSVGLVLLSVCVLVPLNNRSASSESAQPSSPRDSAKSTNDAPAITREARLYVQGLNEVAVARSEDAFEKFLRASARGDRQGQMELALAGDIFLVPNGTKVLVLEYGFAKSEVRMLDGPSAGASGWVPREWVQH